MKKDITIVLDNEYEDFVLEQIKEGKFKNEQEVLFAGLKLLQDMDTKTLKLKHELEEGLTSGIHLDFEPNLFLQILKTKKTSDGL